MRGASLRGGKMRGTVRGINARRWVICEAGICEAQRTTGAAGVVVGCERSSLKTGPARPGHVKIAVDITAGKDCTI